MSISRENNEGVFFGIIVGGGSALIIFMFIMVGGNWYQTTTPEAITECAKFCEKNEGIDYIKVGEDQDGCHCKNKGTLVVEKD